MAALRNHHSINTSHLQISVLRSDYVADFELAHAFVGRSALMHSAFAALSTHYV